MGGTSTASPTQAGSGGTSAAGGGAAGTSSGAAAAGASVPLLAVQRCGASSSVSGCGADQGGGYVAYPTGEPDHPFRCDFSVNLGQCARSAFGTLQACLEVCDPTASARVTACTQRTTTQLCEENMTATQARLEGRTPLGLLSMSRARLDHFSGFTQSVHIAFTEGSSTHAGTGRTVSLSLYPSEDRKPLTGSHLTEITLSLCDVVVSIPVAVDITVDHVTPDSSGDEHFEGSFHALSSDLTLQGEFRFERVCQTGVTD